MRIVDPVLSWLGVSVFFLALPSGCERPRITARNLDRRSNERDGIPFYLPKPYLIISKNVRYIPPPSIGLTETVPIPNSFDPSFKEFSLNGEIKQGRNVQASRTVTETISSTNGSGTSSPTSPASGGAGAESGTNASSGGGDDSDEEAVADSDSEGGAPQSDTAEETESSNGGGNGAGKQVPSAIVTDVVPAGSIEDGLIPHTFYTYQFVYLPDLTQKYGLDVRGGNGEFRGTMNLVNGWMNTGAGPFYFRDSSTAASIAATGLAMGNVIDSAAGLSGIKGGGSAGSILPELLQSALAGMPHSDVAGSGVAENAELKDYAEIYIFEPRIEIDSASPTGKSMEWHLLTTYTGSEGKTWPIRMNRHFLGTASESTTKKNFNPDNPRAPARPRTDDEIIAVIRTLLNGHGCEYIENSLAIEPRDPNRSRINKVMFQVKPRPGATVDKAGATAKIAKNLKLAESAVTINVVP